MVCRLAFFVALDIWDHLGIILRSAIYMIMYYSFAQPRAIIWQMYLVTYAIMYACTGMAYLLSQVKLDMIPWLFRRRPSLSACAHAAVHLASTCSPMRGWVQQAQCHGGKVHVPHSAYQSDDCQLLVPSQV